MNNTVRNILAIVSGVILGGAVNFGIIAISSSLIPLPEGVDPTDMESIKSSMYLYQPKHFAMPFLAHAMGTLIGAFIASVIAFSHKKPIALSIGFFFLAGGIINALTLPAPAWFIVLDLSIAYVPMAWLGWKIKG